MPGNFIVSEIKERTRNIKYMPMELNIQQKENTKKLKIHQLVKNQV